MSCQTEVVISAADLKSNLKYNIDINNIVSLALQCQSQT